MVIFGNTSSTFTASAANIAGRIVSFSLVNKTGGATTVSIGVFYGSTYYFLYSHPLTAAGAANSEYVYSGKPITIPADHAIHIAVSGSTDYYISIEDV